MRFDTKVAIVVREDLATWQKLNVTAFLASGIGGAVPGIMGDPYEDGSGTRYLPMLRQPVLVYAADGAALARVRTRAVEREMHVAVYIVEMFKTGHDEANREAVRTVAASDLTLVGVAVHGPKNPLDKILKGLALHP